MNTKQPLGGDSNNNGSNNPPTYKQVKKIYATRVNQRQMILAVLKTNGYISTVQMLNMGIYSSSKRICELKESGYIIKTTQDWSKHGLATYWYLGKRGVEQ